MDVLLRAFCKRQTGLNSSENYPKRPSESLVCINSQALTSDLVKLQDDLDALMEEVSLADQASAVQGHQLLLKIDGEDVQVDPSIQPLGFPQRHRAQRTSLV